MYNTSTTLNPTPISIEKLVKASLKSSSSMESTLKPSPTHTQRGNMHIKHLISPCKHHATTKYIFKALKPHSNDLNPLNSHLSPLKLSNNPSKKNLKQTLGFYVQEMQE